MALGLYRAEYNGTKYFFKGLEDGFCCGFKEYKQAFLQYRSSHREEEIANRILLIPQQLLTFNTETE